MGNHEYQQHVSTGTYHIRVLPELDSTNDYLKRELSKDDPPPHGTVILAEKQWAGRGQQEARWQAQPGANLTFSVLLYPLFLRAADHFRLTQAVSLALYDTVAPHIASGLAIKWPNDLLVNGCKLAGVLVETATRAHHLRYAVVGIGLNVNQQIFPEELQKKATSLALLTGKTYSLEQLLRMFCQHLHTRYLQLEAPDVSMLQQAYHARLWGKDQLLTYHRHQTPCTGFIRGVLPDGRLHIQQLEPAQEHYYQPKEISFSTSLST